MQNAYAQQPQAQAQPANKATQQAMELVDFLPQEAIQFSIQADGFFLGTNPLAKLIGTVQSMLVTLTGGHIRVFVFVTNQRVIMVESTAMNCGAQRSKAVKAIALASVAEVGWSKETQMCCVHSRMVNFQSKTEARTLVIKKLGDEALRNFMQNLSAVIVANA